jgi:hypothetical protein
VLLPLPEGGQIPMEEIADVKLVQGPSMIRNENGLVAGLLVEGSRPGARPGHGRAGDATRERERDGLSVRRDSGLRADRV